MIRRLGKRTVDRRESRPERSKLSRRPLPSRVSARAARTAGPVRRPRSERGFLAGKILPTLSAVEPVIGRDIRVCRSLGWCSRGWVCRPRSGRGAGGPSSGGCRSGTDDRRRSRERARTAFPRRVGALSQDRRESGAGSVGDESRRGVAAKRKAGAVRWWEGGLPVRDGLGPAEARRGKFLSPGSCRAVRNRRRRFRPRV